MTKQLTKNKYDRHEPTTTTELQAPDLGQHIKNVVGLNMFVRAQPSPNQ